MPRIAELYPDIGPGTPTKDFLAGTHASVVVHRMRDDVVGNFGNIVWISGTAGILLLLISFANVASLLLTRAEGRQRELAVRVALGAGPSRVISQFLAESFLLALLGGALGLCFAFVGVRAFVRAGPPGIPRLAEMGVDASVVGFAVLVTLVMAALCSIVPAIRYDTRRLASRLRDGTRGGTQRTRPPACASHAGRVTGGVCDGARRRRRNVVPQHGPPAPRRAGLRRESHAGDVPRAATDVVSHRRRRGSLDDAARRSREHGSGRHCRRRDVEGAIQHARHELRARHDGCGPNASNKLPPSVEAITATGGYFKAMGIPLLAGRTFDREDRQDAREVIIDRALAVQRWHDSTGRAAIGRQLWFGPPPAYRYTIIGVVGAVHDTSLAAPPNQLVYFPQATIADTNQTSVTRTFAVVTRTTGDPHALITPVQRAIADVDKSLPAFAIAAMSETLEQSMGRLSFVMTIIGVTASVALLLAAIGLYGVLAYIVSLRSREISVRLAMGAMPGSVARLVTRQGAGLAGVGVVAGVAVFLASSTVASRGARRRRVGPMSLTIAVVTAVLMAIALAASWIPARRAARVDPARALAGE